MLSLVVLVALAHTTQGLNRVRYSYYAKNPYKALAPGDECKQKVEPDIRDDFLEAHNHHRSRVARGLYEAKDQTLPPAADMIQLRWSCDLEKAAQVWSDQCEWRHDTPLPLHSESLWRVWGPESYLQKFRIGVNATVRWAREFEDLGMEADFHNIGHAMLMTYSDQILMGCGYTKCKGPQYNHLFVVCRYFSNGQRKPDMYKKGEPVSACPDGYTGNNDTALCEANEIIHRRRPSVEDDPFSIFAKLCRQNRGLCNKWKRLHSLRIQKMKKAVTARPLTKLVVSSDKKRFLLRKSKN